MLATSAVYRGVLRGDRDVGLGSEVVDLVGFQIRDQSYRSMIAFPCQAEDLTVLRRPGGRARLAPKYPIPSMSIDDTE